MTMEPIKMEKSEQIMLAKIEERLNNFKEDMTNELHDIKDHFSRIYDRININSKSCTNLSEWRNNHQKRHENSSIWIRWIPTAVALGLSFFAFMK